MALEVSVIVPCYNVSKYIKEVLFGILAQNYPIKEIILINDCSVDQTKFILKELSKKNKKIKIINLVENSGLANVRNYGVLNSKTEYVAFLDGDVVPFKDWLRELMKNFNNSNIAGVGGSLIEKNILSLSDQWRKQHMSQEVINKNENVSYLGGNNVVYLKKALVNVGLWDTSNKTNGEDVSIGLKLKKLGYTLVNEPDSKAYHLRTDNIYSVIRTRWNWANAKKNIKSPEVYSLTVMMFKIFQGFVWTIQHIKVDLITKKYSLLLIDFFMPFYWAYFTIKKYFEFKLLEFENLVDFLKKMFVNL